MSATALIAIAALPGGILSTVATVRLLDRWFARPPLIELSRYSEGNLSEYAERRDALADADPDFLTDYARRVALWQQIKAGNCP